MCGAAALFQKNALDKDLKADEDQNDPAEDRRAAGEPLARPAAEEQAEEADRKRHRADDQRFDQRRDEVILRDRKADGQRVDRSRDALHQKASQRELRRLLVLLALSAVQALMQHGDADVKQQRQRDPGDEALKTRKAFGHGAHAQPAEQRHEDLEQGKAARDLQPPGQLHARVGQRVGNRNRKGVHRKADAEERAVEEKGKVETHVRASETIKIRPPLFFKAAGAAIVAPRTGPVNAKSGGFLRKKRASSEKTLDFAHTLGYIKQALRRQQVAHGP